MVKASEEEERGIGVCGSSVSWPDLIYLLRVMSGSYLNHYIVVGLGSVGTSSQMIIDCFLRSRRSRIYRVQKRDQFTSTTLVQALRRSFMASDGR